MWRHGTPSASASGFKGEGQLIARPHAKIERNRMKWNWTKLNEIERNSKGRDSLFTPPLSAVCFTWESWTPPRKRSLFRLAVCSPHWYAWSGWGGRDAAISRLPGSRLACCVVSSKLGSGKQCAVRPECDVGKLGSVGRLYNGIVSDSRQACWELERDMQGCGSRLGLPWTEADGGIFSLYN